MKFRSSAAFPAAFVLLCAGPALAHDARAATSTTEARGFSTILDALAAGAGYKPAAERIEARSTTHGPKAGTAASRPAPKDGKTAERSPRSRDTTPKARAAKKTAVPAGHKKLRALVATYARKAGIPVALAHSVVMVESRYRPHVTGPGGYIGLMQLSYRTARGMGFRGSRAELYDPETNIRYGVRYLAEAYRLSGGNLCATVSKYQGGTGVRGVTRAGAVYCGRVRHYMADMPQDIVQTADNAGGNS